MERNWEVVRAILLRLEALGDTSSMVHAGEVAPFDFEIVGYHMQIMQEAGLIEARVSEALGGATHVFASRLTWEGHEFLDRIRDQTLWNRVKASAREKGLAPSFDVITAIATTLVGAIVKGAL